MDQNTIATPDLCANSEADHVQTAPHSDAAGPAMPLPGLEGYAVNGADPHLADLPALAGLDPDVPGVRLRADWRRDSARKDSDGNQQLAFPWSWIEDRRAFTDVHRGREWSQHDLEARAHMHAQTWGAADVGARNIKVPVWMRSGGFICPRTGEPVEIPKNPRVQRMLAIVWDAFAAGTGGALLSRAQWAQELSCSPRSVYTYQCQLLRLGLLRRSETLKPATDEFGGRIAGSTNDLLLLRIGPMLDSLAPMAFEAGRTAAAPPRRGLFTRRQASKLAGTVRKRARAQAHQVEGRHHRRQCHWSGRTQRAGSNTPAWSSSTPRPGLRPRFVSAAAAIEPRRPTAAAPAAPVPAPSSDSARVVDDATAPQDAQRVSPVRQSLPSTPPPLSGGSLRRTQAPPGQAPDPTIQDLAPLVSSSRAVASSTTRAESEDGAGTGAAGADAPPDAPGEYEPRTGNPRADARREVERLAGGVCDPDVAAAMLAAAMDRLSS